MTALFIVLSSYCISNFVYCFLKRVDAQSSGSPQAPNLYSLSTVELSENIKESQSVHLWRSGSGVAHSLLVSGIILFLLG